jgi:hypothetical protein
VQEILNAAVRSYNAFAHGPVHGRGLVAARLDGLLDLAERFDEPELAGCLLMLIICKRQENGLARCSIALRHVLAELGVDLPLDGDAVMAADTDPPSDEFIV